MRRLWLVLAICLAAALPARAGMTGGQSNVSLALPGAASYSANTATTSATLTTGNISGGTAFVVLNMTGTLGAGANATLPTVAALVAALNNPVAGASYILRIYNSSSADFAWTVLTASGWTLTGTSFAIAKGNYADFQVKLDSLAAATLQSLGQVTYAVAP